MKRRTLKVSLFLLLLAIPFGFYKFMTYDRIYNWSKEFEFDVIETAAKQGFEFDYLHPIDVNEIKLPTERFIKIKIQKLLSHVNLMDYGNEFGEYISLSKNDPSQTLICKGWCLSDHVIGIEVQYENIPERNFISLRSDVEQKFSNYKIIWTKI